MRRYIAGILLLLSFMVVAEALVAKQVPINKKWFLSDTTQHPKKQLKALRIEGPIRIDGVLNEEEWARAPVAGDFFTFRPSIGDTSDFCTRVKTIYSNQAIYFGAVLYDHPDRIIDGLSKRDDPRANADKFWVTLNPYNDGKNIFQFEVTAANVQNDMKISPRNHDRAWDAVWNSAVTQTDSGWVVEMRIPYDAIRFPKTDVQTWGINFWRLVRRERAVSSWNLVDRTKDNKGSQYGELMNIRDIEAPFRLSLFPYVSGYVLPDKQNTDYSYSAGMDLKYGINESFTLDMILVPDFGQKKSDDRVLNLSPYEVKYNEQRPFFTEGTELFNKAGLFYSRRIGGRPSGYGDVYGKMEEGEQIINNPDESNLMNATKISGRNQNGLGLGFFNAFAANTYATVRDENDDKRRILTQPFTNYNMMVIDKNYGQNSYLNLINTNYYQPASGAMEDVIGTAFKVSAPGNYYALWGNAAYSMKKASKSDGMVNGEFVNARIGKVSGKVRYNYHFKFLSDDYDHNAMGYLRRNNQMRHGLDLRYGEYEPQGYFQNWRAKLGINYNSLYQPREFTSLELQLSGRATLNNYISLGLWSNYRPAGRKDFFEPRVDGRVFKLPPSGFVSSWLSTDYRKTLAFDARGSLGRGNGYRYSYEVGPRIRLNHKAVFRYKFKYDQNTGEKGYVTRNYPESDTIVFGRRNKETYTNTLGGSFVFDNKSWITLNVRHYWSKVDYNRFYTLKENGNLNAYPGYQGNEDLNFNVFNVDLMYSWNFAPGSFLNVVWKNNIYESQTIENNDFTNFFENFRNTLNSDRIDNSFSIKISYYLDYKYLFKNSG
jgi:hypothetical protein